MIPNYLLFSYRILMEILEYFYLSFTYFMALWLSVVLSFILFYILMYTSTLEVKVVSLIFDSTNKCLDFGMKF